MDVLLLRWPADATWRQELVGTPVPRLLLVEPDADPPVTDGCLEDWVRLPAPDGDMQARVATLRWRARDHGIARPEIDEDGVLRFRSRRVPLPPIEARLTAALIERFDAVVTRDALAAAGWPDGSPVRNVLDVHMLRLRRRLGPLGLTIRTVRSRGYLLEGSAVRVVGDG